jgi:methylthioribose-1-phosphate isomerase
MGEIGVYNCGLHSVTVEDAMSEYFSIRWDDGIVRMLDQRLLPHEVVYRNYRKYEEVASAIREMVIRGAPAIGAAAGFGLALAALQSNADETNTLVHELQIAADVLGRSRPTAVNLSWAINRIMQLVSKVDQIEVDKLKQLVVEEAQKIADEDIQMNHRIAINGLQFIPDTSNIIHHCNTGALATVGYGTALGVIRAAHESGKKIHVYVDETRPRLQGARLTSWELKQLGIPHTVIVDGASGFFMKNAKIDACLVGCDRIAANGDVANKIGTYNLALVAFAHGVSFYSVGPTTTIDLSIAQGEDIPIEERSGSEITQIGDTQITPDHVNVANPAFDVTPAKYITAIITNAGVAYPPYRKSLSKLMKS